MKDFFLNFRYKHFSHAPSVTVLIKEVFRKSIHLLSALIPFMARARFWETIALLCAALVIYTISEFLRLRGTNIPLISSITRFAARERDGDAFVLGPVTLVLGIVATLLLFPFESAELGIWALAFGDGLASLIGKLYGNRKLSAYSDKTFAGSLACFTAVFLVITCATKNMEIAFCIAGAATFLEALPLKNLDNMIIPIGSAALAQWLLQLSL